MVSMDDVRANRLAAFISASNASAPSEWQWASIRQMAERYLNNAYEGDQARLYPVAQKGEK